MRLGANCLDYLKRRRNRKERMGSKDFIKWRGGGQTWSRYGCLLKAGEGGWKPLTDYVI